MERNYYKEAQDIFRNKREAAERERAQKLSQVHAKIPKIREIDKVLSMTGAEILSVMMGGGDTDSKVSDIRKRNDELRETRKALLVENGFPPDYTAVKYECENCADSGYMGIDMCPCMKLTVAELRLNDSELGRLSADQTFENFDLKYYREGTERDNIRHNCKQLYEFANNFDSKTEQCWLLLGNTGLGKTHLSTAVGITVIRRGYDVIYKTVQSVIDDFREVQFKGGDSDSMKKYYDCDLLIVDDLGAEMANQFTVSCIYNLINTRMNKRKPTIFSTNLTPSELRERYADRITSRLFGEYASLMFTGTDVRRQKLGTKI